MEEGRVAGGAGGVERRAEGEGSSFAGAFSVAGEAVLELGAGTGLVGLAARKLFGAKKLLLTDLPPLCPLLEANLRLNGEEVEGSVRPLLWQEAGVSWLSEGHSYSRVLMSDVLYHQPQYAPLHNALRVLVRCYRGAQPLKVFWAQEAHNPKLCSRFKKALTKEGWAVELVTCVDDGMGAEIFVCKLAAPTFVKRVRRVHKRSKNIRLWRRGRRLRKLLFLRLRLRKRHSCCTRTPARG